jgi:hypothetical protein
MPRPAFPCPFFKKWTHTSAYVLGYWFADGSMRARKSSGPEIYFVSNDLEHLETIAHVIEAGTISRVSRFRKGYRLTIKRRELYEDLQRLGGTEQKSLHATWLAVPCEFLADFVRGSLDGDGHIGWRRNKNHPLPMITLYGTPAFVTDMARSIKNAIGVRLPPCLSHNHTWDVTWLGIQAKCLAIWLYQNRAGIAMPRKAAVAAEVLAWESQRLNTDNIIVKMWELFGEYLR